jgi:hypothetical protein
LVKFSASSLVEMDSAQTFDRDFAAQFSSFKMAISCSRDFMRSELENLSSSFSNLYFTKKNYQKLLYFFKNNELKPKDK